MTETQLKNRVLGMIRKEFPSIWGYKASDNWTSGIPDWIGCVEGKFAAMEFKSEKGKLTVLQSVILSRIQLHGGFSREIRSVDEARAFLQEVVKCKR